MSVGNIAKVVLPAIAAVGLTALVTTKSQASGYEKGYKQGQKDELVRSQQEAEKAFDRGLRIGFDTLGRAVNKQVREFEESERGDDNIPSLKSHPLVSGLNKSLYGIYERLIRARDSELTYNNVENMKDNDLQNGTIATSGEYSKFIDYLSTGEHEPLNIIA